MDILSHFSSFLYTNFQPTLRLGVILRMFTDQQ